MPKPTKSSQISPEQIDHVTARFYARIRMDPTLAPIFAATVADNAWPAHEARVAAFWRNALLEEDSYSGNPLDAHNRSGLIKPAHFHPWLALLDEVLTEELAPEQARAWSNMAHRIGKRLTMGMQGHVPPHLQN